MRAKDVVLKRFADLWCINWEILKDILFLIENDLRFASLRGDNSIRYIKASQHLKKHYKIHLSENQLRYFIRQVRNAKQYKNK